MGLLSGLLLLPLAPVRGTMWIAERLLEQAEQELDPERRARLQLQALQVALDLGELTPEEYEREEDFVFSELEEARAPARADDNDREVS